MEQKEHKILLVLPPFWTPFIPPIGIACLKSYLKKRNYIVKTIDTNVEIDFTDLYDRYFNLLKANVPENKQGNFYAVGHDILRNQLMAYLNYTDEKRYDQLIKVLVQNTFYTDLDQPEIEEMKLIVNQFYRKLETYMVNLIQKEQPTIFGLSVFSDTLPASIFSFKLCREKFPSIQTIMGGGVFADHLSIGSENLEIFLKETESYIDKIFIGEAEILMHKMLKGELPEAQRVYTLQDINQMTMKLDEAELIDISDFEVSNYPYIVSYTSRSCPFQCSFCSETIQWGKYRKKAPDKIFNELMRLHQIHNTQLFLLSDSLLNPVIQGLAKEFKDSDQSIYWGGWFKVDNNICNIDKCLEWRRGGFYQARMGIESGSPHVLELMGKQISLKQIRTAVSNLANVGVKTTTLWVVGHPGETEEDFQQTLNLIEELKNDIYEAECRPFYFFLAGQAGSDNDWWSGMNKVLLYPEEMNDMLMLKTWYLECEPSREVIYKRMNRFVAHCKKLGIPNPYSMHDIFKADERWQNFHKNAVPPLVDFKSASGYIDECKRAKKMNMVSLSHIGSNDKEYSDFEF